MTQARVCHSEMLAGFEFAYELDFEAIEYSFAGSSHVGCFCSRQLSA